MIPLSHSIRCLAGPCLVALLLGSAWLRAAESHPAALAAWVEPDFPFYSSVVDARKAGAEFPTDNLTPRGLVLKLGNDLWACFDPDLLRVAAVWHGNGVTPNALAPGSYHDYDRKTPGGQTPLPVPEGTVWLANGIYPGAQGGARLAAGDPREPAPSPEEVGRGPIAGSLGRFEAVRLVKAGVVFDYTAAGTAVREWMTSSTDGGRPVFERHLRIGARQEPLVLALGRKAAEVALSIGLAPGGSGVELTAEDGVWLVRMPAHAEAVEICISAAVGSTVPVIPPRLPAMEPAATRWPQEVTTSVTLSTSREAYVVDRIGLPTDNPWRRGVRPSDVQFLPDGTGLTVTLDGDVWVMRGLADSAGVVRWRRLASGLHEPMSIAIRDGEIFAFDRNGIWRLRDTNNDGEADVHELFSNAFAQTADMREFPSMIRLAPGGEFIIAKGGQQAATLGKHNGSVLRVSADGRRATVLGYGFRQPNIGVSLRTGLVTSSDQQGQYIPSTPLHLVRDGQFYGFLAPFQPREQYPAPIAEPLTWLPHPVNASATSQVWLFGAKLGPLNDSLVHLGFNKPELFRVLWNDRGTRPQAAVVSVTREFGYPLLHGSVNPADGLLYIAGFQVLGWGNIVDTPAGLGRVRYTGAPVTLPREVIPMKHGVLLRFDVPLDRRRAEDPASYSLASWNYQRSYRYGSPQYKADGTTGQDAKVASSAYLAADGRSVFVAVPDLQPAMQWRIGWSLATADGQAFAENAYLTAYELVPFDPAREGFGNLTVNLTPRAAVAAAATPISIEEGRRLAVLFACAACHAGVAAGGPKPGPTWVGLFGRERPIALPDKKTMPVLADEAYLRESILNPTARFAAGFGGGEFAMPSYAGVLSEPQIESLILYIKSLR